MATPEEVLKFTRTPTDMVSGLAKLARISVTDEELPKFVKEFDAILGYISQLEALDLPRGDASGALGERPALRNVMRTDGEPHEAGKYTEKIAEQFSAREGNALSVKQIVVHE